MRLKVSFGGGGSSSSHGSSRMSGSHGSYGSYGSYGQQQQQQVEGEELQLRLVVCVPPDTAEAMMTVRDLSKLLAARLQRAGALPIERRQLQLGGIGGVEGLGGSAGAAVGGGGGGGGGNDDDNSAGDADNVSGAASGKKFRIKRLETLDGYVLDESDRVLDVLRDGDAVRAVGYGQWLVDELPRCKSNTVCDLARRDYSEKARSVARSKFISVGVSDRNRLFVLWGAGGLTPTWDNAQCLRLDVIDPEALEPHLLRSGEIGSLRGVTSAGQPWEARASFLVVRNAPPAIELELRVGSDRAFTKKRIEFSVGADGEVRTGRVIVVDDPNSEPLPKGLELPTAQRDGETVIAALDDPAANASDARAPPKENAVAASQFDESLSIVQDHKVITEINQDGGQARRGDASYFTNEICTNLRVHNNSTKSESVLFTDVESSYQDGNGNWVVANVENENASTLWGSRNGVHYYRWQDERRFTVGAGESLSFAVGLRIKIALSVNVHFFEDERRLYRTLPSPLKIRTRFVTSDNKEMVIETVAENPPLQLVTPESAQSRASDGAKLVFFCCCDDLDSERRQFGAVFTDEENGEFVEVKTSNNGTTRLRTDDLQKLEYRARVKDLDAVEIKDLKQGPSESHVVAEGPWHSRVYGLIDKASRRCYALKFDLKSNTGRVVEYFALPDLKE